MIEKSLPKLIFKHNADVNQEEQTIQIIYKKELRLVEQLNVKCITSSKNIKKALRKMKSFTPLSVAMRVFDNPTEENKSIRAYIDQFVSRLTI